jgi:hypothetical protein
MFRYPPELAQHYLVRSFTLGDDVKPGFAADEWLISSSSDPSLYWLVTKEGCRCPSFKYRGHCRHFVRAAFHQQNATRAARGEPLLSPPAGWTRDGRRIVDQLELSG